VPVLAAVSEMVRAEAGEHAAVPLGPGWAAPPDPYPPRASVLS
jgi:hypothetical protein